MMPLSSVLVRAACTEIARLRWVRGPHRRTRRRVQRAQALLALAAVVAGSGLVRPASAITPRFFGPSTPLPPDASRGDRLTFPDLDGDSDFDLVIDRNRFELGAPPGTIEWFENTGTRFAPKWGSSVEDPFGLHGVSRTNQHAFVDIDADGDLDAFVVDDESKTWYFENTGSSGEPAFAAPIVDPFGLHTVPYAGAPQFVDLDADGDADAIFGTFGSTSLFENTGTAGTPAFSTPVYDPFDFAYGWDPIFADVDGDGDFDAFVARNLPLQFAENVGTPNAAVFAPPTPDTFGLAGIGPVFVDLDADGDQDAFSLAGYADGGYSEAFFVNIGSAEAPAFLNPFAPFGLADAGPFASLSLADLDADGDTDAIFGQGDGAIRLFENVGTPSAPAFGVPQTGAYGLGGDGKHAAPAFGDLDADGDLDALVGTEQDPIYLQRNIGSAQAPSFDAPSTGSFGLPSVGFDSAPALADLDADGDLDLLVGQHTGLLVFFSNTGTAALPAFAPPATNPFGLAGVGSYASPAFDDIDGDGDLDLFVGRSLGHTLFFENTGSIAAPSFAAPLQNPFGLIGVGSEASPAFADIDADGDTDGFVVNRRGRVSYFRNVPGDPVCGDGRKDPGERCDDGNAADGDGCSAECRFELGAPICPPSPEAGCSTGFEKTSLAIDEMRSGREKLALKLQRGPALQPSDLGDPTLPTGTVVALCLYDDQHVRVGALQVEAGELCGSGPCWKALATPQRGIQGFAYRDKSASSDGVRSLRLRGGNRSQVDCSAANDTSRGRDALPLGTAAALVDTTSVTVQLHTSDAACLTATLSEIGTQEPQRFKAR